MMQPEIRCYLDEVRSHLRVEPSIEQWVIRDLYGYFQEKVADLQNVGLSEKEAVVIAIESCGRPRVIAQQMYEAHSKGKWTEAAIASLPHLIMAGLFGTHFWWHPFWALIGFGFIIGVTLYGWWHGKPSWLYPWVGYSLLPLVIGIYACWPGVSQGMSFRFLWGHESLPDVVALFLTCALFAFSVWIVTRTTINVVRRDWILASMMLVPLPIFGGWLLNLEQHGGLFSGNSEVRHLFDTPMVLALATLAVTSATFIRLRQRVLKIGALVIIGSIALAMIAHHLWGDQVFLGLIISSLLLLLFVLSPAVVETKVGHETEKQDVWWENAWPDHSPIAG